MIPFIYDIIYLVSLSLIPSLWAVGYTYDDAPLLPVLLISVTVSSVILIFIHLKTSGKIILGGALITVAAASVAFLPDSVKTALFTDRPYLAAAFIIPALVTIIGKPICQVRFVRPVISGVMIALLAYAMYSGSSPSKVVVAFVFFFAIVTFADEIQNGWKKNGKLPGREHIVFISPFLAVFLIIILIFPAPDEPYDWALAKKIIETAQDRFYRFREYLNSLGETDSADSFLGFSEYASLGNGTGDNDKKVLEVVQVTGSSSYAYLAGKTFDTFDGYSWHKDYEEDFSDSLMDCLETLYAAKLYAGDDYPDYVRHGQLNLTVLNMYTSHLFTPHKYYNFISDGDRIVYNSEGGDPFSPDRMSYGDAYSTEYFRLNTDSPAFLEFLESDLNDDRLLWSSTVDSFYVRNVPGTGFDDLVLYRNRMRDVYLTDTEISPELDTFLEEYFADCVTDAEKLRKLEKLFNAMKYNLQTEPLPDDIDTSGEFLDYLIFEKQEGYCVHYATAFVLISRHIGIPARFVQGYRVPLHHHGGETVTESLAHAWPECYMDGIGWITYEPTPGFRVSERWKTSDELTAEREQLSIQDPYQAYDNDVTLPETVIEEHEESHDIDWRYPALIAGLSAAAALILLILIRIIGAIRYRLSDDEKKYRIVYSRNIRLLKIMGYARPDEETLEEFGKRISADIPEESLSFLRTYESYAYRNDGITKADVDLASGDNRSLLDHLKKTGFIGRLSVLRYYLFMM